MVEFLENYFKEVIQCVGSFYWVIGIMLMFVSAPHTEEYKPYRKAQRFLSLAFIIMGTNLFAWIFFFQGDWTSLNPYVACCDVTLFYLAAIFLAYCYSIILDKNYLTRTRVVSDFVSWGLASGIVCSSLIPVLQPYAHYLFAFSVILFLEVVVRFFIRFHHMYQRKRQMLDNYFSDDMQRFLFWQKKSLALLVLSGVVAVLTMFFGIYLNYLYQVYVVSVNMYIAVSFINYRELYGQLNAATLTTTEEEEKESEPHEVSVAVDNFESLFGSRLAKWVEDKKYLVPQLTIEDLATEMGTNKLYMSRYINGKFAVNFSSWITELRLDEAKEYMRANPNVKQEEVAFHSGFSSSSYFSKVFSRVEGKTPAAWRKEQATA